MCQVNPPPALAKGLRKATPYNVWQSSLNSIRRTPPPPLTHSRKHNYRVTIKYIQSIFRGFVITEREYNPSGRDKDRLYEMVVIHTNTREDDSGERDLGISRIDLSYRKPTIHSALMSDLSLTITNHVLERIFQRGKTTDHVEALSELYATVAFFQTNNIDCGDTWEIGTGRGMAIVRIPEDPDEYAAVVTWVDAEKLRSDQSAEFMKARKI